MDACVKLCLFLFLLSRSDAKSVISTWIYLLSADDLPHFDLAWNKSFAVIIQEAVKCLLAGIVYLLNSC